MTQALLEINGVSKSFGNNRVLHNVSLSLYSGEVVSIIGENGAGKSTLAKIIAGIVQPDCGTLKLNNQLMECQSPLQAMQAGIGIVHQELCLAHNLSVSENIFLGREPSRFGISSRSEMRARTRAIMHRLGVDLDPTQRIANLPTAKQQMVEIARALSYDAQIVIFDEPTSSLSEADSAKLLQVIKELRAQGVAIIYVSHRLAEVMEISDRIVCLRDGNNTGELLAGDANREKLISLIVGRELTDVYGSRSHALGQSALEVRDWRATQRHTPTSFDIKRGEIVALAGLIGSGRSELLESIFGIYAPISGTLRINGSDASITSPHAALRNGIALLPEDRKEQGLILERSIADNIILANTHHLSGRFLRSFNKENASAELEAAKVKVRYSRLSQPVRQLSGGNQQKVVLARCLATNPQVLLLDEPTRGIDIGARCEIYSELRRLAASGLTILMVSSDLEEVVGLADRVLVMSEGSVGGELSGAEISEQSVMCLASPESGAKIAA